MATPETATDSGRSLEASEGSTRTQLRIVLPEEILQALKKRAETRGVSVVNLAAYLLAKAVMED